MREFLRAHRLGAAFADVPEARFLRDAAAGFEDADLAFDFVFERLLQVAEGVQILDFGLGAELLGAAPAHADVGIAAQRAFFHVAVAHFGVLEHLLERVQIGVGLGGRAQIGFGDDFGEGRAAAVVVDVAAAVGIRETLVQVLRGVLFEMQTGDADSLARAVVLDFEPAGQWPAAARTWKSDSPWADRDRNSFCGRSGNSPAP